MAMMNITIDSKDLIRFQRVTENLAYELPDTMTKKHEKVFQEATRISKRSAPKWTGILRQSIGYKRVEYKKIKSGFSYVYNFQAQAPYASYLEYGTKPHEVNKWRVAFGNLRVEDWMNEHGIRGNYLSVSGKAHHFMEKGAMYIVNKMPQASVEGFREAWYRSKK